MRLEAKRLSMRERGHDFSYTTSGRAYVWPNCCVLVSLPVADAHVKTYELES
jgi:hypothetical protein